MTDRTPNRARARAEFDTFARNLKRIRSERRWTQGQLAGVLGTPQTNVGRWEARHVEPKASTVVAVAKALRVTPNDLLLDEEQ